MTSRSSRIYGGKHCDRPVFKTKFGIRAPTNLSAGSVGCLGQTFSNSDLKPNLSAASCPKRTKKLGYCQSGLLDGIFSNQGSQLG
jgi:hypothetical protein